MKPIYLDFETYWSTSHTLSRMSPTEYIQHPDTEIISVSIKEGDEPTYVLFGEDNIRKHMQAMDWSDAMAIGHNMSGFDSTILAWRLGVNPKMYGCTAAMARSRYSKTAVYYGGKSLTGVSLKKLAAELDVGIKLDLEATNTKGKHLVDFSPDELASMEDYNKVDTELCAKLFKKLIKGFPKQELVLIDMTTRMLVEPQLLLDAPKVHHALRQVKEEKRDSLVKLAHALGIATFTANNLETGTSIEEQVRTELASAVKFGALLTQLGVPVPMKVSPTNANKMTPALAKTDDEFIALQTHKNPLVASAAMARLEAKSTLLETRLEAFLKTAAVCGGKIPVPLKYAGADTTGRWSGEQYNMQNLPRIGASPKPSDALRMSLLAPPGHKVIVSDLSGIELRVNMFLWKVPYAMELFKASPDKADLYRYFAANDLYNIDESQVTKTQRQVGKVAHLGLGFGAGGATFQKVAKLMGGVDMSLEEATNVVDTYRSAHSEIKDGWRTFQNNLTNIKQGIDGAIDPWGMCTVEQNAVRLPSGRRIYYADLHQEQDNGKMEWWYGNGRTRARIYAGKGVENLVQALARDVIAEHAVKFFKATGLRPALTVHDELVYVVPEDTAEHQLDTLQTIMRQGVSWWPELITWSEGDIASCYGEAK